MALSRLGDYIELVDVRNSDNLYGVESLRGISINKILTPTKADTSNLNLKHYKVVKSNWFTYCTVTSRNGNKISLAYNDGEDCIVSSINPVFRIKDESKILPRYLMMFFSRTEFDRYARFNSWGSARETFNWEDFCGIELEVPSIEIQKKYVTVYEGMLANLRSYEKGLEDLKLVCDGYIEDLRRNLPLIKLESFIEEINIKNDNEKYSYAIGISKDGVFESERTAKKDSVKGCKLVNKHNILWASQTTCGIGLGAIGMYEGEETAICAPTCTIIKTRNGLDPYYLLTWLRRTEFWRYAKFVGSGVVEKFDSTLMGEVKIPIPNNDVQLQVSNIYKAIEKRKSFINSLKTKIAVMCPILIRGSILEAKGGI